MQVIALIGDLVASKTLPERGVFQRQLTRVLAKTSAGARDLASPYTITLGDEFQAVYRGGGSVFADIFAILAAIYPVQARFAIGVGELSTRINSRQALGMDGPAFHQARATLIDLKGDGGWLRVGGVAPAPWQLTNHTLNLLSHQAKGWSRNRLLILAGLLRGATVPALVRSVKISRVAVYKNIRAAALNDVVGICQEINGALDRSLHKP
jgi:hypothetical protein